MGVDAEMLVINKEEPLTEEKVQDLSWELCEAFGSDRFWIWKAAHGQTAQRALNIVNELHSGGPTLYPALGEQFIYVALGTRYYGPGYERGDLPFIVSVADWLERNIPYCSIWYGGDSSGIEVEPFDKPARDVMFAHFSQYGHRPYSGDPRTEQNGEDDLVTVCEFCTVKVRRYGFGGKYGGFRCPGCGETRATHDGGLTWQPVEKEK